MERTYSRAINKQEERTGSLFRKEAKAKDGLINEFITVTKSNGKPDYRFLPGSDYGFQCLQYLHNNPVKARMTKIATDYQYSSAKDYAGLRNGSLCNLDLGRELLNFI